MITINNVRDVFGWKILELVGLSTDEEPLNATGGFKGNHISNGSSLMLMDTSTVKKFDEENDTWVEL